MDISMEFQHWRVIIVEDEYDSQQMVSKILTFHGVQVIVAKDGHECLKLLTTSQPTFIVTDLAMPGMDGWQTLQAIRANPITEKIPVIAITAYHSPMTADGAMKAGFNAYFSKPVDPRTFVQSLAKIIAA